MKLFRVSMTIVFAGLMSSCNNKDFTGQALNNYLTAPGDSTQCHSNKTNSGPSPTLNSIGFVEPNLFEFKGKKLQILENNYGDSAAFSTHKTSDVLISKGKSLVVVADESCVIAERKENANKGLTSILSLSAIQTGGEKSFSLVLRKDTLLSELEYLTESDPCVVGVGENVIHQTSAVPNDPQFVQQEHLENLNAAKGWDVFFAPTEGIQQDIIIAIIDSGVDQDHPDLINNRWINKEEIAGNNKDDDANGYVDDIYGYNFASKLGDPNPLPWKAPDAGGETHGTHVAGLAAAPGNNGVGVSGVNGLKSKIMSLNVFGSSAGASTTNIDNAIRYAANKGAHIINMSLGGPGSSSTTDAAIKYAISKGVVVIMAAGNSTADASGFTPAKYGQSNQGALAIGATDSVTNIKCGFSNFSKTYVELAAPGCKSGTQGVLATLNGGGYGRLQGTSMASPIAAGVASLAYGLIWSRSGLKPGPALVEEVLKAGSRIEAGLSSSFLDGKVVDLVSLSIEINKRFPASDRPTNPNDPPNVRCP